MTSLTSKILPSLMTVCLFAVPAFAKSDSREPDTSDSSITLRAKMGLFGAEGVHGTAVHVDTINGMVTLHGKVGSDAERDRAAAAANVLGVKSVRNLLQVVAKQDQEFVADVDSAIKDKVVKMIKGDSNLANSSIRIKSVNKGVVLLSGMADSEFDLLLAMQHAAMVSGVRKVATEVKLRPTAMAIRVQADAANESVAVSSDGSALGQGRALGPGRPQTKIAFDRMKGRRRPRPPLVACQAAHFARSRRLIV